MQGLSTFRWADPRHEGNRGGHKQRQFSLRQHSQRFVVPMEGSHVDVDFPSLHRVHSSASRDVLIDQRTHVFVFAVALAPQLLKRA